MEFTRENKDTPNCPLNTKRPPKKVNNVFSSVSTSGLHVVANEMLLRDSSFQVVMKSNQRGDW